MKSVSHIILAALVGSGAAIANEQKIDFSQHDRNGDGYLTQNEWTDVGQIDVGFNELDRNGDQLVDKQELRESRVALKGDSQSAMHSQRTSSQASDRQSGMQAQQTGTQQQGQRGGQNSFDQADGNRDGRVTQDEANEAGFDYVVMYYDPIDADGNGYLDENEWDLNETGAGMYDDSVNQAGFDNNRDNNFNEIGNNEDNNFGYYDANDDGYLDENEASENDYVESNFNDWDNNEDGLVDIGEANDDFMEWNNDSFNEYDRNEDGLLDENEARENDYVDANFNDWDNNEDGYLDENEASETWYNDDDTFGSDY